MGPALGKQPRLWDQGQCKHLGSPFLFQGTSVLTKGPPCSVAQPSPLDLAPMWLSTSNSRGVLAATGPAQPNTPNEAHPSPTRDTDVVRRLSDWRGLPRGGWDRAPPYWWGCPPPFCALWYPPTLLQEGLLAMGWPCYQSSAGLAALGTSAQGFG